MRNTFVNSLHKLAEKDKRIALLTGDLGFSVLEKFRQAFPGRFFNMGIAEANMIGAASGMALCGMKPYVYSIVPFATMRCYEQIRNDLCYQNTDVKIIGVGGGLAYGILGPTHHSREDIAIMRALPNMAVVCPGDITETELLTKQSLEIKGPLYMRLGKGNDPRVHENKPDVKIGKGLLVKDGGDVTIISTGNILKNVMLSSEQLSGRGINARVISMHTVKPLDREIIAKAAEETKAIFAVEEHSIIGGLGSAVAEFLSERELKPLFRRIGLRDSFEEIVGDSEYLRRRNSLNPEAITEFISKTYRDYC